MALTADTADSTSTVDSTGTVATTLAGPDAAERAGGTLERAVHRLLELQDGAGWWKGELETNVTMDAEDLLLLQFLGILTADDARDAARWIGSQQRADGTWSTFHGGPPDLSTTVEAYVALRLAGQPADAPHLLRAAAWVRGAGGLESSRVFTRIWLALFGEWRWEDLPALPPEIVLLPPSVPLNIYDFACWARQTIVPLTIVATHRPVRPLPFTLDELRTGRPRRRPAGRWGALDRALHAYGRVRPNPLRALALARAERWILRRQEADGSWGGIQPPWVYSVLALHLQGYPLEHPALSAALEGLERFRVRDERGRRLEACQSPVWDTALALVALGDAGAGRADVTAPDRSAVSEATARAARWLLTQEIRVRGDWAVRRPLLAPGGWAFEFENDSYPDIDDTAEVVMALRRAGPDGPDAEAACRRALAWVEGMQCRAGGWGAFDVDNDREACRRLPFCDFGEVIDPPSADVTAHVVEMLAAEPGTDPVVLARGVDWLWSQQEEDGSWFGRWGANHVYGTGAAVPALVAAGVSPSDTRIGRAVQWLVSHQNSDGGFGEDLRSYDDPAWRGRGASTPSQTAWALLALIAAGERGPAAVRAVSWLVENQRPDGSWDEPWFTGTGFPGDFYINYHLYRLVFPVMALGRWLAAAGRA
ncbi:MAG TPA: squalene--hopene cyclase [Acidimicrobiales bacterium]|nr:squalene--hopene cyclase [Acidimicrobiales bacterium]